VDATVALPETQVFTTKLDAFSTTVGFKGDAATQMMLNNNSRPQMTDPKRNNRLTSDND
jgi:hypothetical protein